MRDKDNAIFEDVWIFAVYRAELGSLAGIVATSRDFP